MSGETLQLFAQLAKVDVAKRQVTGVIADEAVDYAGEIFDYDSSKPLFEKWSGNVAKLSGGKSVGNVRAMHGNIAAGTLAEITFDDVAKTISVVADVVDDNEWNKVLKGVYTGFSIGGAYVKKWADKANKAVKRYTANPNEVSLVDIGCNPNATFSMCKADGMVTEIKFEDTVAGIMSKLSDAATDPAELPALSLALAKAHGYDVVPVVGEPDEEELKKGAYSIGRLAELAESARYMCDGYCTTSANGKPMAFTDDVKKAAKLLYDGLLKMVAEDVDSAKALLKAATDEGVEELRKAADLNVVNNTTLTKLFVAAGIPADATPDAAVDIVSKLVSANAEQAEQLAKYKEQPAPTKGVAKIVVGKEDDGTGVAKNDQPELKVETDPLALMKRVHATGGQVLNPGNPLIKKQ